MHAFRIESLLIGQLEQPRKYVAADLSCAGSSRNSEAIPTACDFDIKSTFDLAEVFIKLTAKIGKAVVIGGLENDISRDLDCIQNLVLEPLFRMPPD